MRLPTEQRFQNAHRSASVQRLGKLISHAKVLEQREVESKLNKLRQVLNEQRIFSDPRMKLLVFTEHKDTLDYLVENLSDDFDVAAIHGGLKLAQRIDQERRFREHCADTESLIEALRDGSSQALEAATRRAEELGQRDHLFPDILPAVTAALGGSRSLVLG